MMPPMRRPVRRKPGPKRQPKSDARGLIAARLRDFVERTNAAWTDIGSAIGTSEAAPRTWVRTLRGPANRFLREALARYLDEQDAKSPAWSEVVA